MSSITVSVPAHWRDNAAFDLVTVNALKAAGIPAESIDRGRIVLSADGSLTSITKGKSTTYTFTPVPPPIDPKDTTIADLQSQAAELSQKIAESEAAKTELSNKVEAATGLINDLQKRATKAEDLNSSLQSQVTASNTQIDELKSKIATAEASLQAAKAAPAPAPAAETAPATEPAQS